MCLSHCWKTWDWISKLREEEETLFQSLAWILTAVWRIHFNYPRIKNHSVSCWKQTRSMRTAQSSIKKGHCQREYRNLRCWWISPCLPRAQGRSFPEDSERKASRFPASRKTEDCIGPQGMSITQLEKEQLVGSCLILFIFQGRRAVTGNTERKLL